MKETHPKTLENVNAQKEASKESLSAATEWLQDTFPNTFFYGREIKPLKIGITKDILEFADNNSDENTPSKSKIRLAVVAYTRQRYYINKLRADVPRIDIEGNEAGIVTEEEAKSAHFKIKRRNKKAQHKRRPMPGNRRRHTGERSGHNPTIKVRGRRSFSADGNQRSFNHKITLRKPEEATN